MRSRGRSCSHRDEVTAAVLLLLDMASGHSQVSRGSGAAPLQFNNRRSGLEEDGPIYAPFTTGVAGWPSYPARILPWSCTLAVRGVHTTMTSLDPSSAEFFDQKYRVAEDGDPWQFATSSYELNRYTSVLSALSGRRYRCAFEPGCSVGVLTSKLAAICDEVVAWDFSQAAIEIARRRCAALRNVDVSCEALTANAPWERFDLVVLCEIGYYFNEDSWRQLVEKMVSSLLPGATVLASHWLGVSPDHLQSGDRVQEALSHPRLHKSLQEQHEGFRMDRWVRKS